ncbi:unnamed protein product [Nesidiocoris tenuis]|uniref:Uncharacterized protein n=1 Tax=Nesidiocoris tenuis TaxID=355587 RepID=A0A6H5GT66_9HEMI|nr:unnamed protein product [Nesidiocoris tenuis]
MEAIRRNADRLPVAGLVQCIGRPSCSQVPLLTLPLLPFYLYLLPVKSFSYPHIDLLATGLGPSEDRDIYRALPPDGAAASSLLNLERLAIRSKYPDALMGSGGTGGRDPEGGQGEDPRGVFREINIGLCHLGGTREGPANLRSPAIPTTAPGPPSRSPGDIYAAPPSSRRPTPEQNRRVLQDFFLFRGVPEFSKYSSPAIFQRVPVLFAGPASRRVRKFTYVRGQGRAAVSSPFSAAKGRLTGIAAAVASQTEAAPVRPPPPAVSPRPRAAAPLLAPPLSSMSSSTRKR